MSTAEAEQNANSNSYREEQCMEFCLSCAFLFLCDSSSHTINSHFFMAKGEKTAKPEGYYIFRELTR